MHWRRGFVTSFGLFFSMVACSVYTTASDVNDGGVDASTGSSSSSSGSQSASSGEAGTASSGSSSGDSTGTSGSSGASSTSSTSSSSTGGSPLTEFETNILNGFNAARASASPTPTPALPVLYWDYEAAASCLAYTATCPTGDAPNGMVNGGGTTPLSAADVVALMTSSAADYTYFTNDCHGQANCKLYKIVVNRSAVKVGCSITTCDAEDTWACIFTPIGSLDGQPY